MDKFVSACPVTTALNVLGGKWKVIILWHLQGGVKRFSELQKGVKGISQKMLTQELRELEEAGLVNRKIYAVVPPRVEYRLTEFGQSLDPVIVSLRNWGLAFQSRAGLGEVDAFAAENCADMSEVAEIGMDAEVATV